MDVDPPGPADLHLQWGAKALWRQLEPLLPGLGVEVVARCASTSGELLERARLAPGGRVGRRHSDVEPCLLVAEHQTGGRGRLGRVWRSAPGASLTFSLALPLAPRDWSGLSLAVGVALAEALDPAPPSAAPRLLVKWPNDLWRADPPPALGRKLGGVLIETLAAGAAGAERLVVVGIGLNVLPLPAALHAEVGQAIASVSEIDLAATAPSTLFRVALPLVEALRAFERDGFAAFADRFAARDLLCGRPVAVGPAGPGAASAGIARGVDATGALVVEADGIRRRIASGEVSVRPTGPPAPLVPPASPR